MSATLEKASDALISLIADVQGMKAAPEKPPEKMSFFPFAVAWPMEGTLKANTPGEYRNIASLRLEVHVGRVDLPVAVDSVYPFLERVADVLFLPANVTLNDTVDTLLLDDVLWTFGELNWGAGAETATIGFRFTVPLKYRRVAT